jgi:hypothetical protein
MLAAGIPIRGFSNFWGYERDYELATCGAVLNISKNTDSILEIYRLWHSLCMGTQVISEKGADDVLVKEWSNFVCFVEDPSQITSIDTLEIPAANRYKLETSFTSEVEKLLVWIDEVIQ